MDSKNLTLSIKRVLAASIVTVGFGFFTYLSISSVTQHLKNRKNLTYVEGEISDVAHLKTKIFNSRRETTYKNVLVLSLHGSEVKFGFLQSSDTYKTLLKMRKIGKNAEIYYDSSGKRIEFDITLHVFDLKIGNNKIRDFSAFKRKGWPTTLIFIASSLVFLILMLAVFKQIRREIKN